jgi:hypothetical protein
MGIHYGKADFITYGRPSLFLDFANKKSLTDRISGNNLITFTRTSTGTYVGADGLIKSATTNEARFDHNPSTRESLGLLIEESRYNICSYSEDFSNSYWSSPTTSSGGTFTITSNSETSPDGTLTADKCVMQVGATSVSYSYWYIKNSGYSPNGTDRWIWSFYVKSAGAPIVTIGGQHGGDRQWSFNLSTGLPVSNYGTTGDSYQYMGNGWYRLSLGWVPTLGAYGSPGVNFGCSGVTGDGNVGIYMWGAQLEKGDFLTSYIPTPSTTVITRNADSASITGTNLTSFYNQTQGTLSCRFRNFGYGNAFHAGTGISFDNSQFQRNMISLNMRRDGPFYRNGTLVIFPDNGVLEGTGTAGSSNNINDTVNYYNFVGSFSASRRAFTYNGLTPGVNTPTITMPTISRFIIDTNSYYAYDYFCGHIAKISYYPFTLTDTQLQNLTR